MANPNLNHSNSSSSSSSIDPNSGFCSDTKIYHSLRPLGHLPPETAPLSTTDYVFSLLHQNSPSPETAAALIDATTGRRIPYSELVIRTENLAAHLQLLIGLSRADSAFVLSPNSVHLPILYLTLFSLGVIVSPSNPTSSKSEISRQIQLCKPVIAFATAETAHKVPPLRRRTILLDSVEFESMMTTRIGNFLRVNVSQSDTMAILYSSGTTGKFKGVELTHRNFISAVAGSQAARPVTSSSAVNLCVPPYFHVYGFLYSVRTVAMGESLVSMGKFDLQLMIRAIEGFRVTYVALAPPVIVAMLKESDLMDGRDLRSLQVVASAGAPLPKAFIERFNKRFPTVQLSQCRLCG